MANEGHGQDPAALEASERVDATRIELEIEDGTVVITGAVASAEQATLAETVVAQFSDNVSNNLRVDRGLRGCRAANADRAGDPAEGEVLIGSTDMLAGPEAEITDDISIALQENVPGPPMEPTLLPTAAEYGGDVSMGDGGTGDHTYGGVGHRRPVPVQRPDLTKEDRGSRPGCPLPSPTRLRRYLFPVRGSSAGHGPAGGRASGGSGRDARSRPGGQRSERPDG